MVFFGTVRDDMRFPGSHGDVSGRMRSWLCPKCVGFGCFWVGSRSHSVKCSDWQSPADCNSSDQTRERCRLRRLVLPLQCAMPQKLRSKARPVSGSMESKHPFCCTNTSRLPCTCSTDTFFNRHCSRTHGVVSKMMVSRRRSSGRIVFACRKIQLARSQKFREVCSSQSMTT